MKMVGKLIVVGLAGLLLASCGKNSKGSAVKNSQPVTSEDNQQSTTKDPMGFSEKTTKEYAKENSDMKPYGLERCSYLDNSDKSPKIECIGYVTVLVFGGHEATAGFSCVFSFSLIDESEKRLFTVLSGVETCQ